MESLTVIGPDLRPAQEDRVISSINYTAPLELYDKEKPFYCNVPAPDGRQTNQKVRSYPGIIFHNIRDREDRFTLDNHGFQIVRHGGINSEEDFSSDEWIGRHYYPTVEEMLRRSLGCSSVKIFDHTVRKRQLPTKRPKDENSGRTPRQPSLSAHADQTFLSGENRVKLHMGQAASSLLTQKCQIINVWRPLFGPLQDAPLAYCDWQTVDVKRDFLEADLIFPHYIGEQYLVKYHPDHRWYFLDNQMPNEFTLLKCWDNRPTGVARCVPHTSFMNPRCSETARLRESIELRCLVFYGPE